MTFDDIMDSKIEVEANVMVTASVLQKWMEMIRWRWVPVDKDDTDDGDSVGIITWTFCENLHL